MTKIKNIGPIPQLGFGTWNHDGVEAYNITRWALETGYRHIDTAEGYNNEEHVGRAISESGVARKDIFITTKIAPESYAPGKIMGHVKTSLHRQRLAARRRHRHYEHHARLRDRAHARDRHPHGRRRARQRHPAAVSH